MANIKLPIVDPLTPPVANTGSDLVSTPPQTEQALSSADTRNRIIERKVYIKTVKDIEEYDYPQAVKTWAAFEAIGYDPGELVANALEQGHGYKAETLVINGPFMEKDVDSLLGESLDAGEKLVSYKYVPDEKLLDSSKEERGGMEVILQSKELAEAEEDNRPRAVKLIAILRRKLPNLLK